MIYEYYIHDIQDPLVKPFLCVELIRNRRNRFFAFCILHFASCTHPAYPAELTYLHMHAFSVHTSVGSSPSGNAPFRMWLHKPIGDAAGTEGYELIDSMMQRARYLLHINQRQVLLNPSAPLYTNHLDSLLESCSLRKKLP